MAAEESDNALDNALGDAIEEFLIEAFADAFELLDITKCDVFTPESITNQMTKKLIEYGMQNPTNLLEPSVGEGALLQGIDPETNIDAFDIKDQYLDKIDTTKFPNLVKHSEDFLKADIKTKYDQIIMNPPYLKIQDLPTEYRKYLKEEFKILGHGLVDIYYAFILKCINCLSETGVLVCITPNSYLFNKSAINLRKYLFSNRFVREIIDFGSEKVFSDASVYCCITILSKHKSDAFIFNGEQISFDVVSEPSYLIHQITCKPGNRLLKDHCKINNGIATLRDNIYIKEEKMFDEPCWKVITNGKQQKYVLFPYSDGKLIEEEAFKKANPKSYKYLEGKKAELALRDRGNKTYGAWYAFGRSQSVNVSKAKQVIYVPTMVNPANITVTIKAPQVHHNCLCIEPKNEEDIHTIAEVIKNSGDKLAAVSTKRANGWITLSSRNLYELSF